MRIGFVASEFVTEKYFYGGLANYLYRTARCLASLGHEVHIITSSEIDEESFIYEGINIHRVKLTPLPAWFRPLHNKSCDGSAVQRVYFNFLVYKKLKLLHNKRPFSIVQLTNWFSPGLLSGILLDIPFVVRLSSHRALWYKLDAAAKDIDHTLHVLMEKAQLRICRNVYAPSRKMKHIYREHSSSLKVRVIYPPAYADAISPDVSVYDKYLKNKQYLLFFGRFQVRKGFHILAQALPDFLHKTPDAYAVFVGKDYKTKFGPSMKEYAARLNSTHSHRLIFLNQQKHAQLYPIIQRAKLVVLPSLIENLSNACLEAMMLAKPVIGTEGTSFEELIKDGENGFLAKPGDANSLKEVISMAWRRNDLAKMGNAAKQKTEEFAPEHTIGELVTYFNSIIKKNDLKS